MSRLVPITIVLAVAWAVFTHPREIVYTLGGFAAGVALTSSLPWFLRWAQGIARDAEGAGSHGVRNTAVSTQRGQASTPAKGVRIPITDADQKASMAKLERGRHEAVAAFQVAGIPVPPEAQEPISQTEPILALQQHAIALGAMRVAMRQHAPATAATLTPYGGQRSPKPWIN